MAIKLTVSGENIHITNSKERKAVEFALYGKARQDGEPTPENPIEIEVSGESYNLAPYPYSETTHEEDGIIWTDVGDGTIIANGTASDNSDLQIKARNTGKFVLKAGTYILSGCPSGGSSKTYRIGANYTNSSGTATSLGDDYGDGVTFTINEDTLGEGCYIGVFITIFKDTTAENLTFKPMIRKADAPNDRYMPYGKGSVEVKSVGKNLLPYPYSKGTFTHNGVTFTDNGDGSLTMNGTATANIFYYLIGDGTNESGFKLGGKYIVSTKNYISNVSYLRVGISGSAYYDCTSEKEVEFPINSDIYVMVRIGSGEVLNNVTIYPMIRLATDTAEYEPYKETLSTIPTPNGLAGIKVDSGGNYTDQSGQQWICDEVVKYADGSGAYIQRIGKVVFDGSADENIREAGTSTSSDNAYRYGLYKEDIADRTSASGSICSHLTYNAKWENDIGKFYNIQGLFSCVLSIPTLEELKTWLNSNPITFIYPLAEPITTPLTAEEIAEISTFYPVTNISNDFDCGMRITYVSQLVEFKEPKTDWTEKSRFNIEDYNRIKNNLEWLYQKAVYLNRPFEIEDMGEDIEDYLSYWKVSSFNAFEDNIEIINNNIHTKDYGITQRFYENGAFIKWTELNRIESATLSMKNILDNHEKGLRKIPFVLGRFKEIRV